MTIKDGKSRHTGNIGHTRHRTKTNKQTNKQKTKTNKQSNKKQNHKTKLDNNTCIASGSRSMAEIFSL